MENLNYKIIKALEQVIKLPEAITELQLTIKMGEAPTMVVNCLVEGVEEKVSPPELSKMGVQLLHGDSFKIDETEIMEYPLLYVGQQLYKDGGKLTIRERGKPVAIITSIEKDGVMII